MADVSPFTAPARPRTAALVWGAALVAYVVAVTGRTSLGVAGLQAVERFEIGATTLSLFSVVQLAVYAAAQVPVGLLLDRFGSRKVIAVGAVILALGQLTLALVDTFPMALAARVLVGVGDATAFISVIRLVPAWFASRLVPLLTQATGIVGASGQIVSAVPFLGVLVGSGWTAAFGSLAGAGLLAAALAAIVVRDRPPGGAEPVAAARGDQAPRAAGAAPTEAEPPATVQPVGTGAEVPHAPVPTPRAKRSSLREVAAEPGTWLGFFTHFVCLFPTNTFTLLWGVPFLTAGQGVDAQAVSMLLSLSAVVGIVTGPVAGEFQARHPLRRSWLVIGSVLLVVAAWIVVLVPGTPRPMWQLVALIVALTVSATASNVGFDFVRTSVPPARLGTATGLVNVGGFVASLISIFLVGMVLDLVRPSGAYELDDFRIAFASQAVVWLAGMVGLLVSRRATRRRMADHGVVVPQVRHVVQEMRARRRDAQ